MREDHGLVVGGGRSVGDRCIIPIIRTLALQTGGGAAICLTPVALVIAEGDREYLAVLPGAPQKIGDLVGTLRTDIEQEKERCAG